MNIKEAFNSGRKVRRSSWSVMDNFRQPDLLHITTEMAVADDWQLQPDGWEELSTGAQDLILKHRGEIMIVPSNIYTSKINDVMSSFWKLNLHGSLSLIAEDEPTEHFINLKINQLRGQTTVRQILEEYAKSQNFDFQARNGKLYFIRDEASIADTSIFLFRIFENKIQLLTWKDKPVEMPVPTSGLADIYWAAVNIEEAEESDKELIGKFLDQVKGSVNLSSREDFQTFLLSFIKWYSTNQ